MTTCTCIRCGHTWESRIPNPVKCADCKSRLWNTPRKVAMGAGRPKAKDEGLERLKALRTALDVPRG